MCYFLVLAHAPLHMSEHVKLIFGEGEKSNFQKQRWGYKFVLKIYGSYLTL